MRTLLAGLLLAGPVLGTHAQWGLRLGFPHLETSTARIDWCMLAGMDVDLGDRNSLALDYVRSLDLFGRGEEGEPYEYNGEMGVYHLERRTSGMTLRSLYFFSDNDDGASFYLGPFIGFRKITMDLTTDHYDYVTGTKPAWARDRSAETTLIPAGFRMGFRGALDGFSGDIYLGIGQQFGNIDALKADHVLKKDRLQRLFIQFGYSYGIGWR